MVDPFMAGAEIRQPSYVPRRRRRGQGQPANLQSQYTTYQVLRLHGEAGRDRPSGRIAAVIGDAVLRISLKFTFRLFEDPRLPPDTRHIKGDPRFREHQQTNLDSPAIVACCAGNGSTLPFTHTVQPSNALTVVVRS